MVSPRLTISQLHSFATKTRNCELQTDVLISLKRIIFISSLWNKVFKVGRVWNGEGNGNPLLYSCQENHVDRGAWWAAVHRVTQSRRQLKWLSMHACTGEGNGNPLQYSCLENPRDRGAWGAAIYGVAQSWTQLKQLSSSSSSSSRVWNLPLGWEDRYCNSYFRYEETESST